MDDNIKKALHQRIFTDKHDRQIKRYIKFIEQCQTLTFDNYKDSTFHTHHIVPRSWGGSNETFNLIRIPARYHFVAHQILYETGYSDMIFAFQMMRNTVKDIRINSITYQQLMNENSRLQAKTTSRPVINLNTRQVFDSTYEASRSLGLGCSLVCESIFKGIKCGGYYQQYKDVVDQSSIEEELQKCIQRTLKMKQERPVYNLTTGELYPSVSAVAELFNMKKISYLTDMIRKGYKCHGYYQQYKDVVDQSSIEEELQKYEDCRKEREQNRIKNQTRPIVNLSTKTCFENIKEASKHHNVSCLCLLNATRYKIKADDCYWQQKDVVDQSSIEEELHACTQQKDRTPPPRCLAVVDLNTRKTYNSCYAAAVDVGLKSTCSIQDAIRKGIKAADHYQQWKEIVDKSSIEEELQRCLQLAAERRARPRTRTGIKLICVEMGVKYDSLAAAANAFNAPKSVRRLRDALTNGGLYRGYHQKMIE